MFRKIIGLFFAMSILVALTISGCTYANPTNTNPTENSSETEDLLPKGYTIEKIKYAFEDYKLPLIFISSRNNGGKVG